MIKANFNAYSSYVTDSLHQWDINQVLAVTGLNLTAAPEVHFSNSNTDRAIVRQADMLNHVVSVGIPNSLLQEPLTIKAHIGIYEGNTFKVVELIEIPVIPRKRPADYQIEDSDEELYSFKKLENALANKATNARVDNIIAHNNDTNSNTELVDIRVGADDNIYPSAGAAVRAGMNYRGDVTALGYSSFAACLDAGYYSFTAANIKNIDDCPQALKSGGILLVYKKAAAGVTYQEIRTIAGDAFYRITSSGATYAFAPLFTKSEETFAYRGDITELGYNSFASCKACGFYKFGGAALKGLTDAPEELVTDGTGGMVETFHKIAATVPYQRITNLKGKMWERCGTDAFVKVADPEYLKNDAGGTVWYSLGDSIAQGYYSKDGALLVSNTDCWAAIVARLNRYTLINYAVGGSGYVHAGTVGDKLNARDHVDTIDFSGCDLVTLAYGVNDWKYNAKLGSMGDSVATGGTFYSNMRYVIEKILADNPLCKIIVITPLNCGAYGDEASNWGLGHSFSNNGTLEEIFAAEKEVCEHYGIELLDMTHASVVNRKNISAVLPDGVHPSLDCHNVLAKELANKIMFK